MKRITILMIVALSGACFAQEQSLGDLARQQRSAHKPRARRIIDNDNLPHATAAEAMNGAVTGGAVATADAPRVNAATAAPSTAAANPATAGGASAEGATGVAKNADQQKDRRAIEKLEQELKDGNLSEESRQVLQASLQRAKELVSKVATVEQGGAEQSSPESAANTTASPTSSESGSAKAEAPASKSE